MTDKELIEVSNRAWDAFVDQLIQAILAIYAWIEFKEDER
mgnify:CR=1 FL=1